jgi:hypothetical protein
MLFTKGGCAGVDCRRFARNDLSQAEVEHFCQSAPGDKNVGGLNITVNNPFAMSIVERIRDRNGDFKQLVDIERPSDDQVSQGLTIEELHRNKRLIVVLADLIDGTDIGVVQGGRGLGFTLEPVQCLAIAGKFFWQELQRDKAMQSCVFGLIDHAHPATAEFFEDAVVRNGLADHWRKNLTSPKPASQMKATTRARIALTIGPEAGNIGGFFSPPEGSEVASS